LELVAAAGVDKRALGQRRTVAGIARAYREAHAVSITGLDGMARETLTSAGAGVAIPLSRPGEPPCGVLAVFSNRRGTYGPEQIQTLTSYGSFLAALLRASPAATGLSEAATART